MSIKKKSTRVTLVLLGSLGIGLAGPVACSQPTEYRNMYQTRQDCERDNPNANCEYDPTYTGRGVSGRGVYYGPRIRSNVRSPRSVGTQTLRGGFGTSGRGFSGG
jgi:hypothetical protein